MTRLGPEYRGQLPPGAAERNERALANCRNAARLGLLRGVEIVPSEGCSVSWVQRGSLYPVATVPSLPLAGCGRSPCCACSYAPLLK